MRDQIAPRAAIRRARRVGAGRRGVWLWMRQSIPARRNRWDRGPALGRCRGDAHNTKLMDAPQPAAAYGTQGRNGATASGAEATPAPAIVRRSLARRRRRRRRRRRGDRRRGGGGGVGSRHTHPSRRPVSSSPAPAAARLCLSLTALIFSTRRRRSCGRSGTEFSPSGPTARSSARLRRWIDCQLREIKIKSSSPQRESL